MKMLSKDHVVVILQFNHPDFGYLEINKFQRLKQSLVVDLEEKSIEYLDNYYQIEDHSGFISEIIGIIPETIYIRVKQRVGERLREIAIASSPDYPAIQTCDEYAQLWAIESTIQGTEAANKECHAWIDLMREKLGWSEEQMVDEWVKFHNSVPPSLVEPPNILVLWKNRHFLMKDNAKTRKFKTIEECRECWYEIDPEKNQVRALNVSHVLNLGD